jgi:thioredoxin
MSEFVREVGAREWDQEMAGSEVPVLVDFWAEWCTPCHKLSPILERIAEERAGQIKVLKLDTEANPEVVIEHEVRSAPTLVLFVSGAERGRIVGFRPKPRLEAELEEFLASARDGAARGQ